MNAWKSGCKASQVISKNPDLKVEKVSLIRGTIIYGKTIIILSYFEIGHRTKINRYNAIALIEAEIAEEWTQGSVECA